ncbi:Serine/threonine-protein kinase fray2 [Sesamum alatum]|uniref:Serine/threonine-protein kinase fray2 n=1 Tax=Sesamum alatum TaxID=300844 RepID=A0AAE1XW78_9LAMI|nr:Serine/threonine-protein kinase fray2 [Sesamum alatum]
MATNNPQTCRELLSLQELVGDNGGPNPNKKLSPVKEEPSTEAVTEQEDTSTNSAKPVVLLDRGINGTDRFRIMHPIGTASSGSILVYKAAYIPERSVTYETMAVQDIFVAMKYESMHPEPQVFDNLKAQIEKNGLIPDHQNLMGIRNAFFSEGYLCVVFPLMELGSMRSITATRFPGGMSEDCILLVLREALTGLSIIHANGHVHREISAGHIFFNGKPEIKLAFSASVFDLNEDQNDQSSSSSSSWFLPAASICDWAAAPEVHESNNNEYTQEADIWMLGITALELAYGGLRVMNRKALETMVTKINVKKKLPKKDKKVGDLKPDKIVCLDPSWIDPRPQFKKRKFSKGFENLVAKCLNLDPPKRPTADELLQDEIFTKLNMSVPFFQDLLRDI